MGRCRPPREPSAAPAVTARAVMLGALLLPANALWLVHMEMGRGGGPYPTTFSLFANVVLEMVVLVVVNAALRPTRWPRALSGGELLTIYVMLCIGSAVCSVDFLDVLLPMMAHPVRFASETNHWRDHIVPHLAPGFAVRDAVALRGYYEGHSTLYEARHLRAWAGPVCLWSVFIVTMLGTTLCLAAIVRRRWVEHERLAFPVLAVPLALCHERADLWRQPLFWPGFAVAAGLCLVNGIAFLVPAVPAVTVKMRDIGPTFVTHPWRAVGWTPVSAYPFAVGLGFLLPVDLLFSCWFFFLWFKVERVAGAAMGYTGAVPRFPYAEEQCTGAYLAVAVAALWTGRRYLGEVARRVVRRPASETDAELLSYRAAVVGLVLGLVVLSGFYCRAGLPARYAGGAMGCYLLIALACARMRAELGPPAHDLHNAGPERLLTTVLGPRAFRPQELVALTYCYWFNRAYRSVPMAHQLESLKLAERQGASPRTMLLPLLVATIVGTAAGFWAHLDLGYRWGLSSKMAGHMQWFGVEAFSRLDGWLNNPPRADGSACWAILVGAVQAVALQAVRLRWARWPFHPLGLAVAGSWSTATIWLPLLLSWVAKVSVLRYGGIRAYRRALPFFIGLVLGDYLVGCAWPLYGWLAGIPTYSFQQ